MTDTSSPHGIGLGVSLPPDRTPRTTTASASGARTNPISLRLWKIISTSANGGFDDPASHEALEIISERYCGPTRDLLATDARRGRRGKNDKKTSSSSPRNAGAHWLGVEAVRRAGLALDDGTEGRNEEEKYWSSSDESEGMTDEEANDDDAVSTGSDPSAKDTPASSVRPGILSRNQSSTTSVRSVHGQSGSFVGGATNAKRYFKRDLEAGLVEGSLRFLKAFEKVDDVSYLPPSLQIPTLIMFPSQQLQVLRTHMQEMQDRCESVQAEMDKANEGTSGLVSRANGLREQQQFAHIRQEISELFLARFTLTPGEIALLKDTSHASVGRALFEVMDKIHRIRADCRALFEFVGAEVVGSAGGPGEGGEGEGVEGRDVSLVA